MRSLELFAGAGGLAMGLAKAGFTHKAVIELDKDACQTLLDNKHGSCPWPVFACDVKEFDYSKYEEKIELLAGGVPCQPFSIGGKHKGHRDERNMFPEFARAVRAVRPLAFIVENVKGLLRPGFANYFSYIEMTLRYPEILRRSNESWADHLARLQRYHTAGRKDGLTYNVVHQLMNAADFGVPQKRERVFMVGIRADLGIEFCFPNKTHAQSALLYEQFCSGTYWDRHEVPRAKRESLPQRLAEKIKQSHEGMFEPPRKRWMTVRDAIGGLPEPSKSRTGAEPSLTHFFIPGAKTYPGHTGSPLDEPAKTLKAGDHGVPGGENMLSLRDGRVRYFTIRESARLQTFPDEFIFTRSWTESMRQLGNAVPVELAHVVGEKLKQTINGRRAN